MSLENAVETLRSHSEEDVTKFAFSRVCQVCEAWSQKHLPTPVVFDGLYNPLVVKISGTHPQTIKASVIRYGIWDNFDFYYQLALEARRKTVILFEPAHKELVNDLENLAKNPELKPAHSFLDQLIFTLKGGFEKFVEKASTHTMREFQPSLSSDINFWIKLQNEAGDGYLKRVSDHTHKWFLDFELTGEKEKKIQKQLEEDWKNLVLEVGALAQQPLVQQ